MEGAETHHCQYTERCEQIWAYFAQAMSWLDASQPVQKLHKYGSMPDVLLYLS